MGSEMCIRDRAARVDRASVYTCTGKPQPEDVERILKSLLADDFATAFARVKEICVQHGLALIDVVSDLHAYVLQLDCADKLMQMQAVVWLAEAEARLAAGTNEKVQLAAVVGAFHAFRTTLKAT